MVRDDTSLLRKFCGGPLGTAYTGGFSNNEGGFTENKIDKENIWATFI